MAHGRRRRCEIAGELPEHFGGDARRGGRRLGRERAYPLVDGLEAIDVPRQRAGREPIFSEQHLQHRQQHQSIGARRDKEMRVGDLRGLGAPRIDDDQPATTGAEIFEAARHIGRRHQAAV